MLFSILYGHINVPLAGKELKVGSYMYLGVIMSSYSGVGSYILRGGLILRGGHILRN